MQIIFFRHGIAADRLPHQSDSQRPLTDEGIAKTTRIATGLAKLIEQPAAIWTSPKLRAQQTAGLLGEQLHVEPIVVDALGDGSASAIIEALAQTKLHDDPREARNTGHPGACVLVGHEPDLSEAVEMLVMGRTIGRLELKKAGAACVRVTEPIMPGQPCGHLQWLTTPGIWV